MAVDKLSDEDLERLRKAADVAAMKARAAVEGSLSKAVDDTTQALVDARGAEEKAKAGFFAAEAEVKEAVKTLEWEQGCVATRTYPDVEPPGCIRRAAVSRSFVSRSTVVKTVHVHTCCTVR